MRLTGSDTRPIIGAPRPAAWLAALVIVLLAVVFVLDRETGTAPVEHLYYVPIMIAGYRFRLRGAVIAALTAVVLYHVANPRLITMAYGVSDLVQIGLFLAVGIVTARMVADAARLRTLALTDDLTGLHNLRSFETELAAMVRASRHEQAPLALLVLDLDRLKSLNDRHGHLAGAEAVRLVGRIIADWVPPGGVACRYGGDEFAIALPRCPPDTCRAVADTLRSAVHASAPVLAGRQFPRGTLSISVGAACRVIGRSGAATAASRDADDGEALFRRGDRALYQAKGAGRNRVWVDAADTEGSRDPAPPHRRAAGDHSSRA